MLSKPFYGRQFFSPDGDGGGAGGGDAGGDNSGGGDGDNGENNDPVKVAERDRDAAKTEAKRVDGLLRKAQARVAELENAGKSDEERKTGELTAAQQRADAAETKLRTANARSAVTDAAIKANAVSTRAVFALVRDDLEYDDDGEPTNVDDLVAAARKSDPGLFKSSGGRNDGAQRDEESASGKADNRQMNDFIRGAKRR